jgi:hypothetical protein
VPTVNPPLNVEGVEDVNPPNVFVVALALVVTFDLGKLKPTPMLDVEGGVEDVNPGTVVCLALVVTFAID